MGRRFWGIFLLAAAVLLALIVPRVLDPGTTGTARRAPDPPPPPVGSCLAWPADDLVDCAAPHTMEVVTTWSANDPDLPEVNSDGACGNAALIYLGMRPSKIDPLWQTPVPFLDGAKSYFGDVSGSSLSVRIIRAPQLQRLDGPGWKVCAVGVTNPPSPTVGSVAHLSQKTDRPAIFGNCREFGESDGQDVPCSAPHRAEIFGQVFAQLYDDPDFEAVPGMPALTELPTQGTIDSQCHQLLVDLMLVDDPTFDGQLTVGSNYSADRVEVGDSGGAANMGGTTLFAECAVVASAGTLLTDSLIGIGTKPLPLR